MADGALPTNPGGRAAAGNAVASCTGTLTVAVHFGQDADAGSPYMKDSGVKVGGEVKIRLIGPEIREETTETGEFVFEELRCGDYAVDAIFTGTDPLVDRALRELGATRWAYDAAITSYDGVVSLPGDTHKCNFFLYDMIQQVHGSAPVYTYARRFTFGLWTRTVPDLARAWADHDNSASDATEGWRNLNYRPPRGVPVKPGDVLAIAIDYADATGHSAIIAYPEPGSSTATVAGARHEATILLPGQTVYASTDVIKQTGWGFRTSAAPDRESLRSPSAGIERAR